jgi:hypothetical protein
MMTGEYPQQNLPANQTSVPEVSGNVSCLLLSYSPSSGITFYRLGERHYEFSVASNVDSAIPEESIGNTQKMEVDQLFVDRAFDSADELKSFVRSEYMYYHKALYYSLLFTSPLSSQSVDETLTLLDDAEFAAMQLSPEFAVDLQAVVDPRRVATVLTRTFHLRLKRVEFSLATELSALTFSKRVVEATALDIIEGDSSKLERILQMWDHYASLNMPLPLIPASSLQWLCEILDSHFSQSLVQRRLLYNTSGYAHLATVVGYQSTLPVLRNVAVTESIATVQQRYSRALLRSAAGVSTGRIRFSLDNFNVEQDRELIDLGAQILRAGTVEKGDLRVDGAPFFKFLSWVPVLTRHEDAAWRSRLIAQIEKHYQREVYRTENAFVPFSIAFSSTGLSLAEPTDHVWSHVGQHCALLIALYCNAREITSTWSPKWEADDERLYQLSSMMPEEWDDHLKHLDQDMETAELFGPPWTQLVLSVSNIWSLQLVAFNDISSWERGKLDAHIEALAKALWERWQRTRDWLTSHPATVLFTNLIAVAAASGELRLSREGRSVIKDLKKLHAGPLPFVRFLM